MTKTEIIDIVAEGTGLTKLETAAVIDGFLATITYALRKGERVGLKGFGSFRVVNRQGRTARNPKTGEPMHIKPHKAPVFRASGELRREVNRGFDETEFED